ncbi:MAG: diaminopimelate epimerase [Actinobacteria bacterium]|nr:diaminopimelate epimerase [Actinomycetota bacterium]
MQVTKVHGCGNDFVLIGDLGDALDVSSDLVRALCDRHRGVGGDGVIRIAPPRDAESDVFMDYRNSDGGVVEMCGNGVRCVASYLLNRGLCRGDQVRVGSRAGVKTVRVTARDRDGRVSETEVDMGTPEATGTVALRVPAPDGKYAVEIEAVTVSMGNPHAVVEVDDLSAVPVGEWGPRIEHDPAFVDGTNVEFITVPAPDVIHGRIWERGVGETLASGTGASAMAVAAHLQGRTGRDVRVRVPGGVLTARWTSSTLLIRGPAVEVFDAELDDVWLATLVDD